MVPCGPPLGRALLQARKVLLGVPPFTARSAGSPCRRDGWDAVNAASQHARSGGEGLFLREIELENFKSFGRHLRLPVLQGYTAITGPNGSGKSNLADAVLFVLGPKSAKVIRAGRLTDLIYNGGNEGRPAKYCRVSLVFDNADRTIPLDEDEVRLTRYVGISPSVEGGYNSYFYVNGRKATLSDFDDLLSQARISADGYNIVQQGDVARTVEMGPVERRRVLEDMAGISRFDEDIRGAEEERQDVEENLERIGIILEEIRRQLRQLERDRKAAMRYREIKEELERARAQRAHKEVRVLRQQLGSLQTQVERYEGEREELAQRRTHLQEELARDEERLRELEEEVARRGGQEVQEMKERLDALRIERARAQDEIERSKEQAKAIRREERGFRRERAKLDKALEAMEEQAAEVQTQIRDLEAELKAKKEEIAALEEGAAASDAKVVEIQKQLVALERESETVETEEKAHSLERERLAQRLASLEEELVQLGEDRKAREFEVQDAEWQLKEARTIAKKVTKDLKSVAGRIAQLQEEEREAARQSDELEHAVRRLSREYSKLKAEAEAAEEVRRGYTRAVTAILEARDRAEIPGIHGTIAELAQVKAEHEVALKVAAGGRMQAIVVDDDGVAARAIEHLKEKKLGRAIFLPLNKMVPGRPRGRALQAVRQAVGFALDLVSFDEEYRNAFWYVFGDTVVVEDLARARALMGGVRLVTLDGQLVEASGAMVGGQVSPVALQFGQASAGRLTEVGEKLRRASQELGKVNGRLRELREELRTLQEEAEGVQGEDVQQRTSSEALAQRVRELKKRLDDARSSAERREEARENLQAKLAEVDGQLQQASSRREALEAQRGAKREELSAVTPQHVAKELRRLQGERVTVTEALTDARARAETLEAQRALLRERQEEREAQLQELAARLEAGEAQRGELGSTLARVEEELLGLRNMEERVLREMRGIREGRDEAFRTKTEREAQMEKLRDKLDTTKDFLFSLESQRTTLQERLTEAEAESLAFGKLEEDLPPMEEIKATIARCEKGLHSIGAVNLRALEDYEAQEARHDELKEELARLRQERKNLLRLVQELEARKKEGFLEVFHAIRENFVGIFSELAEGGEADLLLEDEEDPFAGGLIVKARPPSKRFLRLEALSGGEKSLVSMAFIFALQEHEPSPFYLLDEVDQNLDAVNAERIAGMIRRNAATAQFIQISLRKVSLQEADHILGVTMGHRGVSEVVMKVSLDDVVEEVPRAEAAA